MVLVLLVAIVTAAGPAVYIVTLDGQGNSYYLNSPGDGTLDPPKAVGNLATDVTWGTGIGTFTSEEYYDFVAGTVNSGTVDGPSKEIYLYKRTNPGNDFQGPDLIGTWSYGDIPADMPVANFHGKVFDVDGLSDFVMVQFPSQDVGLYQNDGSGGFVPSGITGAAPPSPIGADVADIDHDGYADFVVAPSSLGSPPYKIYVNLGNGDGTFTTTSFATAYDTPYWGITATDFDGDKKVDLIATINDESGFASGFDFYQGDGKGGFTFIERFGTDLTLSPRSPVDNYDLDGYGDQDLVASNLVNDPGYVIVGLNEDFGQVGGKFTFTRVPVSGTALTSIAAPPVFPNAPPTAIVSVSVKADPPEILPADNRIIAGTTLIFSSAGSDDPEDMLLEYSWEFMEFKDDGTTTTSTIAAQDAEYTFTEPETCDVTLIVTDNYGETATETVTIHVNHPPVANADTYATDKNTQRTVDSPGVLDNDVDADDNSLTAELVIDPTQPANHGTLALNPDGSFTYIPEVDYTGPDTFFYKANDGLEDSNVATITINVNEPALKAWNVNIVPNMINLKSRGVFIAFIKLPKEYNANDVQEGTVACEGAPAIRLIRHAKFPLAFGAIFRTEELQGVKVGNKVELTVTGQVLSDGELLDFSGSDTVRVFNVKTRVRDETEDWDRQTEKNLFDKFPGSRGNGQDRDSSGHDGRDQGYDH
jgi:hypothetical protein